MSKDSNQDISLVESVLEKLEKLNLESLVVIKSTILPNIKNLSGLSNNLVYNPEFLREKHADDDFINSPLIVFGGNEKACKFLSDFYSSYKMSFAKSFFY